MADVSLFRLYPLRAMYALMAIGLALTVRPLIRAPLVPAEDSKTVVRALLGVLALMAALGIRYPLRMLPILLFEVVWKVIWVVAFALPLWHTDSLDGYGQETSFARLMAW